MNKRKLFDFYFITGKMAADILNHKHQDIVELVRKAYLLNGEKAVQNPSSQFLTFPDSNNRIIALPAYLAGEFNVSGIKWISSYPENIKQNIPRASAVLILNDTETGYPYCCLESSIISAKRTAASAVLGANYLHPTPKRAKRVGFIGTGLIARNICDFFKKDGWIFDHFGVYDLSLSYTKQFTKHIESNWVCEVDIYDTSEALISECDLIILATTAKEPYISAYDAFKHNPTVLNVSLRDLSPHIILSAINVVDDIEHCLTAQTSVHLAAQQSGDRDFLLGSIDQIISNRVTLPQTEKPIIFSPFGMGILDVAVGKYVFDKAFESNRLMKVKNFFSEKMRY